MPTMQQITIAPTRKENEKDGKRDVIIMPSLRKNAHICIFVPILGGATFTTNIQDCTF